MQNFGQDRIHDAHDDYLSNNHSTCGDMAISILISITSLTSSLLERSKPIIKNMGGV